MKKSQDSNWFVERQRENLLCFFFGFGFLAHGFEKFYKIEQKFLVDGLKMKKCDVKSLSFSKVQFVSLSEMDFYSRQRG